MSTKETFAGMPSWVKWVGIIVVALIVFKVVTWLLAILVGLLFKVLLFAAIVAALVFVVRKFMTSSSSSNW
ncbi:DUF5326 family protein [Streptomyces gobiensis]|uniref:DUF5326 family protein n=1 Tax=Streptomyces gobiensis TaxID=2875706 RepID=UPI001E35F1CE|nr:DUF5326 family protein [Streptomyces gobiensis]UGY92519.1 DUF5326 family protein [Streptomyces gobiensis]